MNMKQRLIVLCLCLFSLSACGLQEIGGEEITTGMTSSPRPTKVGPYADRPSLTFSDEVQDEIKDVIDAYIDLRYQSYSTLEVQDFGNLTSDSEIAQELLAQELAKVGYEVKRKELNNSGYAEYSLSLDYYSFTPGTIDNDLVFTALKSTESGNEVLDTVDFEGMDSEPLVVEVRLTENSEFVYQNILELEPEDPSVSGLAGLVHIVLLERMNGQWKIISDYYNDMIWKHLRNSDATIESLLAELEEN